MATKEEVAKALEAHGEKDGAAMVEDMGLGRTLFMLSSCRDPSCLHHPWRQKARRKRLLVDVDEVLASFQAAMLDALERLFGKRIRPEAYEVWDAFSLLSPEETEGVIAEIRKPGWCASMQVTPGAHEALIELRTLVDVYAVTSPFKSPTWVHERDAWLVEKLGFESDQIVHTKAKHICRGDAFLDDKPENVERWRQEHPDALAMLWHIPNTRLLGYDDIRVRSWDEVIERVRKL